MPPRVCVSLLSSSSDDSSDSSDDDAHLLNVSLGEGFTSCRTGAHAAAAAHSQPQKNSGPAHSGPAHAARAHASAGRGSGGVTGLRNALGRSSQAQEVVNLLSPSPDKKPHKMTTLRSSPSPTTKRKRLGNDDDDDDDEENLRHKKSARDDVPPLHQDKDKDKANHKQIQKEQERLKKAAAREEAKKQRQAERANEAHQKRVNAELAKVARGTHKFDECTCIVDARWIAQDNATANRVTEALRKYSSTSCRMLKNGLKFAVESNSSLPFPSLRFCYHAPANAAGALISQSQSQSQSQLQRAGLAPLPPAAPPLSYTTELPPEAERTYANLICVPLTPADLGAAVLRDDLKSILLAVEQAHASKSGSDDNSTSTVYCLIVTHGWRKHLHRLGNQGVSHLAKLEGFAARLTAKATMHGGGVVCRLLDLADADALANTIAIIARFVCEAPYREEKAYGDSFTSKASAPNQAAKRAVALLDDHGSLATVLKQLKCLQSVTQDGAIAITRKYSSLGHLYRRMLEIGADALETELANTEGAAAEATEAAAAPSTSARAARRVGPAAAKRMRSALSCDDAHTLL